MILFAITGCHIMCDINLFPGFAASDCLYDFFESRYSTGLFHEIGIKELFAQVFLSARFLTLTINCKCIFVE